MNPMQGGIAVGGNDQQNNDHPAETEKYLGLKLHGPAVHSHNCQPLPFSPGTHRVYCRFVGPQQPLSKKPNNHKNSTSYDLKFISTIYFSILSSQINYFSRTDSRSDKVKGPAGAKVRSKE
jgi:hypothetical protein